MDLLSTTMPLEITEVFYPEHRQAWRNWLAEFHQTKKEIWLRRFVKASGMPSISYDDLVEECLCFGWIDSTVKKYDPDSNVQRITPRKKKSFLSELNRQRIWKLQYLGLMTAAGIAPIADQIGQDGDPFDIPDWILGQLQADEEVWANFQAFSYYYRRLKVNWISETSLIETAQQRLNHLLKMTKQNKMYGTQPMLDLAP